MGFLLVCMGVQFIINGVLEHQNLRFEHYARQYLPGIFLNAEAVLPVIPAIYEKDNHRPYPRGYQQALRQSVTNRRHRPVQLT